LHWISGGQARRAILWFQLSCDVAMLGHFIYVQAATGDQLAASDRMVQTSKRAKAQASRTVSEQGAGSAGG
jgi:hypothetical protein